MENVIHFGAGNIGRGFIGYILSKSGFNVNFVDVNEEIVNEIKKNKTYNVFELSEKVNKNKVENVGAFNSLNVDDLNSIKEIISRTSIITTSVGSNVLPIISGVIADGIKKRIDMGIKSPLNIIACENMINASSFLKENIMGKLNDNYRYNLEDLINNKIIAFPNCAVDRIVPKPNEELLELSEAKTDVFVEDFYEWIVDRDNYIDINHNIDGLELKVDISGYIERKLFILNTSHAIIAYNGLGFGYDFIINAVKDDNILGLVKNYLDDIVEVLSKKYGFNLDELKRYSEKTIKRFNNPYIKDELIRVAREPLRKLNKNDRLSKPLIEIYNILNKVSLELSKTIAEAMKYYSLDDKESVFIKSLIKEEGIDKAIPKITSIESTELINSIKRFL